MATRHRDILAKLDPVGVNRYSISEVDVETVEAYLKIIQAGLPGETTWKEMIRYNRYYGTSILIHEIVEIRMLTELGLDLLRQNTRTLRRLLAQHVEAHVTALYEEHQYLQEVINRLYGQTFEIATLVKANRNDEIDLQLFLESDVVFCQISNDR